MRHGEKGSRAPEIMVALVAALAAVVFFISLRDVLFTSAQQGDMTLNELTETPLISIDSASGTTLVVRNRGAMGANMTLVRAYINDVFVSCSWDPKILGPGKMATCELPAQCGGRNVRISAGAQDVVRCV